jgi:hypothetical protein
MKLDLDGNMIWATTAGGDGIDFPFGLSLDNTENIYITGVNSKPATFGNDTIPRGGFLAKYNSDGNLIWAKNRFRYYEYYPQVPGYPYTEAPPFHIYNSTHKILINGEINNDTIIIDTITRYPGAGFNSSYIASFDTNGNIEWINFSGGPQGRIGSQFCTDMLENIYITGEYTKIGVFGNDTLRNPIAYNDGFIAKYGNDGKLIWVQKLNTTESSSGNGITSDRNGGIYLSGTFAGSVKFGNDLLIAGSASDMFLARYSSDGDCNGVRQYSKGFIGSLNVDKTGAIILAGSFENTLTMGPNTFTSYGGDDLFVAKCSPITGIEEKTNPEQNQLLIYANPTTGKSNIIVPDDFRNEKNLLLRIFDSHGKVIEKIPIEVSDQKISIDISGEARGIYYVILSNGKKNYSGTIILD